MTAFYQWYEKLSITIDHRWNPLQWSDNGVSNPWHLHCLFNCLFRHWSKKTSNLHVTGLCGGNPPVTGGFPSQRTSNMENVSIWWHHHALHTVSCSVSVLCVTSQLVKHFIILQNNYNLGIWKVISLIFMLIVIACHTITTSSLTVIISN